MFCAACGVTTERAPCTACGAEPLLRGHYRLDEAVGSGAFGTTWRAVDPDGQVVAIKELPLRPGTSPGAVERFEREARVLEQLDHPGIPTWIDDFVAGEGKARAQYIVTSFVEGRTLAADLASHRWSEAEVVALLDEVAGVLAYLHGRSPPVLHRDLKPANLIATPDGHCVLVDFGSVRDVLVDPVAGGSTLAGTFGYMAPEQLVGDASPRSDLYALGALAVALLTRREPRDLLGADRRMAFDDHVHLSPGFAALLHALLSPEPADRPASADRVRQRLATVGEPELPVAVDGPALPERPASEGPSVLLGEELRTRVEVRGRRPVDPAAFGALAAVLDTHLGMGSVREVGGTLRWQGMAQRQVSVVIRPDAEGSLVVASEAHGGLAGGLFGGLGGGLGGGVGLGGAGGLSGLLAGGVGAGLVAPWVAFAVPAAWAVVVVLGALLAARALFVRTVAARRLDLARAVEEVRDAIDRAPPSR